MSVPTITSISPSSGLTIGLSAVKIVGTNFRVAPSPPPAAHLGTGVWQQTVSVTFNGVAADGVMVCSDTLIYVATPEYFGEPSQVPAAVDVVVTNLDNDGNPIAGETVTETDGFTYKRQDLTAEGALKWVATQLVVWFQRHVLENTVRTTDDEYSDDPSDMVVALGALPGIVLSGPMVSDDPYRHDNQEHEIEIETGVTANELPRRAKILGFQVHGFGRVKGEGLNLNEAIDNAISARGRLRILDQRGGSDMVNLQLRLTDSWEASDDAATNVRRVTNALEVSGVKLRGAYGNETGPQVNPDQPVSFEFEDADEFTLEMENGV